MQSPTSVSPPRSLSKITEKRITYLVASRQRNWLNHLTTDPREYLFIHSQVLFITWTCCENSRSNRSGFASGSYFIASYVTYGLTGDSETRRICISWIYQKTRSWLARQMSEKFTAQVDKSSGIWVWHHQPKLGRNSRQCDLTNAAKNKFNEQFFPSRFPSKSEFQTTDCSQFSRWKGVFQWHKFSCRKAHKMKRLLIKRLDWKEEKLSFLSLVFGRRDLFRLVCQFVCSEDARMECFKRPLHQQQSTNHIVARRC